MRHFLPRSRRRVTAAVAVFVASAALLAVPQASADDLKDKQRQNKEQIKDAQSDLHSSSRRMARASARLAQARTELSRAQGVLAAAQAKVDAAEVRDAQMQKELEEAVAELRRARRELAEGRLAALLQREQVAATITEYYQQGDPALIAFASLMDAQTPADLARQTEMRDAIVDREDQSYQALLASEVILDVTEAQVEEAKEDVEDKREAAAAHLKAMEGLRAEAKQARDQVSALVSARRTAQSSAARAKAADQRALAKLKQEEDRIARMLARRAARQGSRAKPGNSSGVLSSPVSGATMTSPYGYRRHPIYGYWGMHDGQDWAAGCGSPLYATASGRIASSYYSEVYGNRLVLDHGLLAGVGVASIYNHATHYTVGVGQRVRRGQIIGYVGSTGWSTGCHLHFTVMVNGKTVDPRKWL
ncbi:peptidoglycan DD-metalloendopeptidase family protein [Nocardioides sp. Y6]|uniref:Peptidoglycan DD-metalloendopeptidase family protein n=1 Tax=Nocardioides malaquae TaxID=2773426 RepID=A0ABR9RQW0_9ACTN|nr:M23 family metallopeptidase [Nocardioides malaquae]MBE7323780.1 peptidoglycan DD-metalloendopeptidase family protein [Nocardioides malaquae]